jgi:hypothetical protein
MGSLQQLLGASSTSNKRRKVAAEPSRAAATVREPAGIDAPPQQLSPVKEGCVRCPICNVQIPGRDAEIDYHVERCLAKAAAARPRQQATILRFAGLRERAEKGTQEPSNGQGRGATAEHSWEEHQRSAVPVTLPSGTQLPAHLLPERQSGQATAAASPRERATVPSPSMTSPRHPARSPPPGATCFPCIIVGRRHHADLCHAPGSRLSIVHQPDNPADANALLAIHAETGERAGWLPRAVARHLGPLIR